MQSDNYSVRLARSSDFSAIMSILERDYILDEPISRSFILNRGAQPSPEILLDLKKDLEKLISTHPCLVVVSGDTLVGTLALINIASLGDPNESKEQKGALYELQTVLAAIVKDSGLFERYPEVQKVVKLRMMAIDRDHRGRGLATLLLQEAVRWAKENGIELLWSLFNSPASKGAAEKVGFQIVGRYDLLDYRDSEGRSMFAPVPEHMSYIMTYEVKKN